MKKKYIYIEKRKKKNLVQKFGNGYCTICIVRNETVLQYNLLVLDCIAGCRAKVYCNRYCIARGLQKKKIISQYKKKIVL